MVNFLFLLDIYGAEQKLKKLLKLKNWKSLKNNLNQKAERRIMSKKELVLAQAEVITLQAKESLQNLKKIALSEAWKILQLATAGVVQIIEKMASDLDGHEKKDIAISYLNSFYDKVFVIVDVPFIPNIIEPVMHKYIKTFLMIMASASIDATVTIFRQTGIFLRKEQSV